MKCSASLLGLKVGDYFNLCNWQLLPPPKHNHLPQQAKITAPHCPTVLSALSVKDFFDTCNWQLLPQTEPEKDNDSTFPLLLPQVESDDVPNLTVLGCLSVTDFFRLCNWHSLPLEVITQPLAPELPLEPESPLTWQVQAFFQRISWDGSPEIGKLPPASALSKPISPASGEMNLNDLSNLF